MLKALHQIQFDVWYFQWYVPMTKKIYVLIILLFEPNPNGGTYKLDEL